MVFAIDVAAGGIPSGATCILELRQPDGTAFVPATVIQRPLENGRCQFSFTDAHLVEDLSLLIRMGAQTLESTHPVWTEWASLLVVAGVGSTEVGSTFIIG